MEKIKLYILIGLTVVILGACVVVGILKPWEKEFVNDYNDDNSSQSTDAEDENIDDEDTDQEISDNEISNDDITNNDNNNDNTNNENKNDNDNDNTNNENNNQNDKENNNENNNGNTGSNTGGSSGGSAGGNTGNETSYDGVKVTSSGRLNMRKGAGTSYSIVAKLPSGAVAKLVSTHGDWYKVTYKGDTGYVSAEYCKLVMYDSSVSTEDTTVTTSSTREKVVAYAKTFLGTKYVYGGTKPSTGFDCSGYVKYVLAEYGYTIPRTSSSQYSDTT